MKTIWNDLRPTVILLILLLLIAIPCKLLDKVEDYYMIVFISIITYCTGLIIGLIQNNN